MNRSNKNNFLGTLSLSSSILVLLLLLLVLTTTTTPHQVRSQATTNPYSFVVTCPDNHIYFANNGTCSPCRWYQYATPELTCVNYESASSKMASDRGVTVNGADTAFMIVSAGLVLVMTPALALFYGGMASEGNVMNTVLLSIVSMSTSSILWLLMGYSIAFGPGSNVWGNLDWGAMSSIGKQPSGVYANTIPHIIYCAFQMMFAQITPALISGAIIGRMTFLSYTIFISVWSLIVYSPLARWVWALKLDEATGEVVPNGFLGELGVLDFAGGVVIHQSAAAAALACSIIVGERLVKKEVKIDTTKLLVGVGLLWFPWATAFNGGSAFSASANAANAFMTTHVANCAAIAVWMIAEFFHTGQVTFIGACTAAVIGLVAITPGCGFMSVPSSIAVGGLSSLLCYLFNIFKTKYMSTFLDDTLDVFLCHGVAGFWGTFFTGVFANKDIGSGSGAISGNPRQIGIQLVGSLCSLAYSFVMSCAILLLLKYTIGIRVSEEEEMNGLDEGHEAKEDDDSHLAPNDPEKPFACFFTDIEKSSTLWTKNPAKMQRALALHNDVIKKVCKKNNVYVVKTIGDAFMAVSKNAVDAARAAIEIQTELFAQTWDCEEFEQFYKKWRIAVMNDKGSEMMSSVDNSNSKSETGKPPSVNSSSTAQAHQKNWNGIRVRIGGGWAQASPTFDPLTKRMDYFGNLINCASRIEAAGHGGQVLFSDQLLHAAKEEDPKFANEVTTKNMGHVHLRGIREPALLHQVLPLSLSNRKFPPLRVQSADEPNESQTGQTSYRDISSAAHSSYAGSRQDDIYGDSVHQSSVDALAESHRDYAITSPTVTNSRVPNFRTNNARSMGGTSVNKMSKSGLNNNQQQQSALFGSSSTSNNFGSQNQLPPAVQHQQKTSQHQMKTSPSDQQDKESSSSNNTNVLTALQGTLPPSAENQNMPHTQQQQENASGATNNDRRNSQGQKYEFLDSNGVFEESVH